MKLVLFDCDGTLVDSAATIHACMEATFHDAGLTPPSFSETKSVIGLSLDLAIAKLRDRAVDREIVAMVPRYKEHFLKVRTHPDFHEPLYDGIDDLMNALTDRDDLLIGMVTGKSRRGVKAVLETHGFEPHFVTSRTADDCPSKPHPAMVLECCSETGIDPRDTFVVGDAIYDMQMARSAGARAIGVSWGYAPDDELVAHGCEQILRTPADLHLHLT